MIFISYRRDDSGAASQLLYRDLSERFGKERVFIDIERRVEGTRYPERILEFVRASEVLLPVIGKDWHTATTPEGSPRIFSDHDMVRAEVSEGIRRGIPLIPVLLGGARMPSPEDLPPDLRDLPDWDGVLLRTGEEWEQGVGRLVSAVSQTTGMQVLKKGEGAQREPYKVDRKTWQWQGAINGSIEQARTLAWQAVQNAVPRIRLPLARQTGPASYEVPLEDYVWFVVELLPQAGQTLVRATVRTDLVFNDPMSVVLGKRKRPLTRFRDSLARSGLLAQ